MWNSCIACSVMTVFGAEVPLGSAPISWITGSARQPAAAVQVWDGSPGASDRFGLAARCVVEDETRDAGETGTGAQDVRVRVDLGRRDPERPQQLRRRDVDLHRSSCDRPGCRSDCAFGDLERDELRAEALGDLLGAGGELRGSCGLHRLVRDRHELTLGVALHNRAGLAAAGWRGGRAGSRKGSVPRSRGRCRSATRRRASRSPRRARRC